MERKTIVTTDMIANGIAGKMVGEIVAADYRTASVFDKYGIDFCCAGQTAFRWNPFCKTWNRLSKCRA